MTVSKNLRNFIRGWLPQEPLFSTHALPTQKKTGRIRVVFLNLVIGLLIIAGFFSALVLFDSWIKFFFVGSILVGGLIWRFTYGNVKKVFKFFVIVILIFSVSFFAVEINLLSNAGHPPTYTLTQPDITISRANILNASLTNILRDIERTLTFKFLTIQFGSTTPETIKLDTSFPGGLVQLDFYGTNSDAHYQLSSSSGHSYHVNIGNSKTTFITRFYPQASPAKDSFAQIDALGLQWFYDQALDLARNRTGSVPNIDALSFTFTFEGRGYVGYDRSYSGYEGITVQIIGSQQTVLPDGSINGHGVLIADFKPDGTLIYMSQPNQRK